MPITSTLLLQTQQAILAAFQREDLRQSLLVHLGLRFDDLVADKSLANQVDQLLECFEKTNNLPHLLECLVAARPKHKELARAYADVLAACGDHVPEYKPLLLSRYNRHDFYKHIDLPENYVPRTELLNEIKRALLIETSYDSMALTSAIKMNALHGMGGIGKTIAARALCDDPDVQAAFPGGILWTTLGQTPNLAERLREWVEKTGGVFSSNAPTPDLLKADLQESLHNRTCLFIVDDVWNKEHLQYFRPVSPASRLLFTTRDSALAEDLGANVLTIPVMTEAESVALLECSIGTANNDVSATDKLMVVKRLGRLPLAIMLAGPQLRDTPAKVWLTEFDADELVLQRPQSEHDSLKWTFERSLNDLDDQKRRLYAALAVFPEDEPLHPCAVAHLWQGLAQLSTRETGKQLHELADRALIQRTPAALTSGEHVAQEQLHLHDLVRGFIRDELGPDRLYQAHAAILRAYSDSAPPGNRWPEDDGYLYDHLGYHVEQLAEREHSYTLEFVGLFDDQAWMQARFEQSHSTYDGYLADLDCCWRLRHHDLVREIELHGNITSPLADTMRFALLHTSLVSLAERYPPAIVVQAVKTRTWSLEKGLSIARRIPDPKIRAALLTQIAHLTIRDKRRNAEVRQEAMASVKVIQFEHYRAEALAALAPQLGGALLDEALAVAKAIQIENYRAEALAALAPQLTGARLDEALAAAKAMRNKTNLARVLTAVIPQLTGAVAQQARKDALAAANAIRELNKRSETLAALAPQLTDALIEDALAAVKTIRKEHYRAEALAALAPRLTGTLLQDALAATNKFRYESYRAKVLAALAPQLSGERLEDALTMAKAFAGECSRAQVLTSLVPQLTGAQRMQAVEDALAAATMTRYFDDRVLALTALAPYLTGALLDDALATASTIESEASRAKALLALAPRLAPMRKQQVLECAWAAATATRSEVHRAEVLAALAPQLTGAMQQQALRGALTATESIKNEYDKERILNALIPQLSGALLEGARLAAQASGYERDQAMVLVALAPRLRGMLRQQVIEDALAAIQASREPSDRAMMLAMLAPQLTGKVRQQALEDALASTKAIRDEIALAKALTVLAPYLPINERLQALHDALAAAKTNWEETWHSEYDAELLTALAPQLKGPLLLDALASARRISDSRARVWVLANLVSRLSGSLQHQALLDAVAAVEEITYVGHRAEAVAALAPQLPEDLRQKLLKSALAGAKTIHNQSGRTEALAVLAPHLTGALLDDALEAAKSLRYTYERAQVFVALAPQLTGVSQHQILQKALATASAVKHGNMHADLLLSLAPHLTGSLLDDALAATSTLSNAVTRAKVLAELAPKLTNSVQRSVAIRMVAELLYWGFRGSPRSELLTCIPPLYICICSLLGPDDAALVAANSLDIISGWQWIY